MTKADDDLTGLHRGICLYPNDVSRREVYADKMEEDGQEDHAEFIRVQIEISKISEELDACWCDDGRDLPECANCLRHRERLDILTPREETLSRLLGVMAPFSLEGTTMIAHPQSTSNGFPNKVSTLHDVWLGFGSFVVLSAPITRIIMSDKHANHDWQTQTWQWFNRPEEDGLSVIPSPLWELLESEMQPTHPYIKHYSSAKSAEIHLSTAALTHARRRAELDVPCVAVFCNKGLTVNEIKNDGKRIQIPCKKCGGTGWIINDGGSQNVY